MAVEVALLDDAVAQGDGAALDELGEAVDGPSLGLAFVRQWIDGKHSRRVRLTRDVSSLRQDTPRASATCESWMDNFQLFARAYVPNGISASRIVMSVVIVAVSRRLTTASFAITVSLVVLATVSDALDGYLARRWRTTSATGYVLDAMGDRAVHLALTLAMLVRYGFHPLIAWLLVFRDIAIYAVRILSPNWLQRSRDARWISLIHTLGVRTWLASYLLRDCVRIISRRDILDLVAFEIAQTVLICASIAFSYWGLFRAMRWTIADEHATIEAS